MFKELLDKLKFPISQVKHSFDPTCGIEPNAIPTLTVVTLPLMLIGTTAHKTLECHSIMVEFLVLNLPSSFNTIIGKPSQVECNMRCYVRSVTLTFYTLRDDTFIYALELLARNNYVATMSRSSNGHHPDKENKTMRDTIEPCLNDLTNDMEVALGKKLKIGKHLIDQHKEKLIHLLEAHLDVLPGT